MFDFFFLLILGGSAVANKGALLPGMRENPAVLRFEKLLLDEVLLV